MKHSAFANGAGQARRLSRTPRRASDTAEESWVSLLARTVEQRRKALEPAGCVQTQGGSVGRNAG